MKRTRRGVDDGDDEIEPGAVDEMIDRIGGRTTRMSAGSDGEHEEHEEVGFVLELRCWTRLVLPNA